MSSAEQQSISGIAVDVDHNPYLAEGAGTVDAIVSIAVGSEMVVDKPPERVEAIIIDCSTSMKSPDGQVRRSETGHQGSGQRNRRRHLLHDHRRHRERRARLPRGRSDRRRRATRPERRRRMPSTACGPAAGPRSAPGSHMSARSRDNIRERSPTRSCSPTEKTSTRPPKSSARRSVSAKANSPVTAGEWAPTGASRNCGRSRRHCWAPWTSSPTRQISPTTSRR